MQIYLNYKGKGITYNIQKLLKIKQIKPIAIILSIH